MLMNRRKNNNLKRPSGKKRKVIGTGVLIVNLIFGGLKIGSAKIQNHKAVTALDYERVISNQELTSSETSDNPEKIIQTGGGIIIAFRQKAHDSSLNEEFNSLEKNNGKVILAKAEGSNPLTPPTTRSGPSNFPTPSSGGTPSRPVSGLNPYRTAPRVIDTGLGGAGANPAGAGGGGGAAEFNDQCSVPNKEQSQELSTHHHDFTQKSKKKKKRNQHLNREIEVNGENFEFERDLIEKKTPSHGTDFGLDPDYGPDGKIIRDRKTGKPRAKQNKENYEKFTDNLSEFSKNTKSEKIEPQYRKGRENEQDAVGFLNRRERRFIIFNRHTKKYITGWVMNDLQYQEFIENNNII
jgi:hypothetical protein